MASSRHEDGEVIALPEGGFILQNLVEGRRLHGESIIF